MPRLHVNIDHVATLRQARQETFPDPVAWALEVLGLDPEGDVPDTTDLRKRFRSELRNAHPDVSGEAHDAADRIAELTEARRILLA